MSESLIICELGFEEPDFSRPEYSMREIDYYAFVPHGKRSGVKNHRLSLRKNLKSGKFEVYRYYYEEDREEVVFEGEFDDALEFAHSESVKFWGERPKDVKCAHTSPRVDEIFCPKRSG